MKRALLATLALALSVLPSLAHASDGPGARIARLLNNPTDGYHLKFDGRSVRMGKRVPGGRAFTTTFRMKERDMTLAPGLYRVDAVYHARLKGGLAITNWSQTRIGD